MDVPGTFNISSLALVPYYLSTVIMSTSDRIMIQMLISSDETAIYSVAYSIGVLPFIISGAFNLSLQPWIIKKINNKEKPEKDIITAAIFIVALLCIGVLLLTPEIVNIVGGKKCESARYIVLPVALSIMFIFLYQLLSNALVLFEKSRVVAVISVIGAVENLALNRFFIPKGGSIVAGYTTLISYATIVVLYVLTAKKSFKENGMVMECYFNIKKYMIIVLVTTFAGIVIASAYNAFKLRIVLIIVLSMLFVIKRKRVGEIFLA